MEKYRNQRSVQNPNRCMMTKRVTQQSPYALSGAKAFPYFVREFDGLVMLFLTFLPSARTDHRTRSVVYNHMDFDPRGHYRPYHVP